jgi:hypothetical protein
LSVSSSSIAGIAGIADTADAAGTTSADTHTHAYAHAHTPTAKQSADRATSTVNTPLADQPASGDGDATAADPASLTPVDPSAGAVMTSAGDDFEQVLGGTFDSDLFDSIFSQDWSQLGADNATGEGLAIAPQSYSLGTYASDHSARHLGSLGSPVSTFRMPMGEDSLRPHAWPFDSSGIQGESSSSSSSGRCPSIEAVVASLLYTSVQEGGRRTSDGPQCECPRLLSQLVQFTNQSSMLSKSTDLALDLLFAMEQVTFSTKEAISKCMDCDLSSPYVAIIICATMDWILENLGNHLRDGSFLDEGRAVPSTEAGKGGRLGSSHPDQSLASDTSTINSPHLLSIGQLSLPEEVSRACIVELLKLRLRRLVRTVKDIVLISRKNKKTLSDVVRCAAKDVCQKAEAMFGMIDL